MNEHQKNEFLAMLESWGITLGKWQLNIIDILIAQSRNNK